MDAPTPDENDAYISETSNGYVVSVDQVRLGTFSSRENAESFLFDYTEANAYYPETWFVNERRNTELLVRTPASYEYGNIGYV